jgi:large subunit ribosomal protein L28
VSKSNRHTKRVWKPNIQRVRARIDGKVRRIYVCTACLKSGRVDRAI